MLDWITGYEFYPPLGIALTVILIVATAMLIFWHYLQSQPHITRHLNLLLLRLGGLIAVAWLLAGPGQHEGGPSIDQPIPIVFLADTSASMAQRDVFNDDIDLLSSEDPPNDHLVTRWHAVTKKWLNPELINQLRASSCNVQLIAFDSQPRAMSINEARNLSDPTGESTDLLSAIQQITDIFRQPDPPGTEQNNTGLIVLLSDGHDTSRGIDPAIADRLRQTGWPVMSVPVGAAQSVADIAIAAWTESDFVFEGQTTWIEAAVTQAGFNDRRAQVDLLHDDQVIESRQIMFDDQSNVRVRFRITPSPLPGETATLHGYRVTAKLLPTGQPDIDESFTDNNTRWVFVRVSKDRIKAVLLEGQPYWDTRSLARVLQSDPRIDLTTVFGLGQDRSVTLQHPNARNQTKSRVLSAVQPDLEPYDVVILGKHIEQFFPGNRAQTLVDYVTQDGGALVFARGQAFDLTTQQGRLAGQIIAPIEPVEWGQQTLQNLKLELTPVGRDSPLTRFDSLGLESLIATSLPGMLTATQVSKEKPTSIVLLRQSPVPNHSSDEGEADGGMAAVAYQNAGRGRVLAVLTDGLWRWSFLPGHQRRFDSVFDQFWTRTIQWLATGGQFLPGQDVSLTSNRLVALPGEAVTVTASFQHADLQIMEPRLTITHPDGTARTTTMTLLTENPLRYTATVQPESPGVYDLHLVIDSSMPAQPNNPIKASTRLAVYDRSLEKLDTSARPDVLAAISQATGGRCYDHPRQLLEDVRQLQQARASDTRFVYRFNHPFVFTVIAAFFGLEWFFRRRKGLL